ncbi:hypothetical protein OAH12_00980 [Cyclobacteriaceae bacterium]|nr:hypothetical protein [Cyclobacteriaceae bacterium]
MSFVKYLLLSVLVVGLFSCSGIQVPNDKQDYIGFWQSDIMYMKFSADGHVEYKRVEGGTSKSINAPLQKFDGDNFEVGAMGMTSVFEVSQVPTEDGNGRWTMIVDGVKLVRTSAPLLAPDTEM